jgi:hypothetical protein
MDVVLTYDLHGADSATYHNLGVELTKAGYTKEPNVDTVWRKSTNAGETTAMVTMRSEFATAAVQAGTYKYNARFFVGIRIVADSMKTT